MFVNAINKKTFQAIFLLEYLDKFQMQTVANGDDKFLEPLVIELMSKGLVMVSGIHYKLSPAGVETLSSFMKRYTEYLRLYDVFAFVDLEKGEFAFSKYFDFLDDFAWDSYKQNERFEDLRIAAAIFKKLDPAEIVFMSFINEGRIDNASIGWQMDLLSDAIWNEIEEICSTALKPEQLGEDAMADMMEQGCKLAVSLLEEQSKRSLEEAKRNAESAASLSKPYNDMTVYEETVVFEENYDSYYLYEDPYYVSPFWLVPLILW